MNGWLHFPADPLIKVEDGVLVQRDLGALGRMKEHVVILM